MPVKRLTAPGSTSGVNILKSGTDYDAVHDASAGTNAGNADTKFTLHAKSGSNYLIRRGILIYDFRGSEVPTFIKVRRAQIVVSDTTIAAPQTDGNQVRVAWLHNPNTFGSSHANDFDKDRMTDSTKSSAQSVGSPPGGDDGVIIELDNRELLDQLEYAINSKTYLHLMIRNQLDYADTTATGVNRVWFDRPNADDKPLELVVYFRRRNNDQNIGRGLGSVCSSGFGQDSVFSGTNSGFGN
mgnify:CR=1 FL=1